MIERIQELKNIITQRINYYSNIGFTALANEFTNVLNILTEIENMTNQMQKEENNK